MKSVAEADIENLKYFRKTERQNRGRARRYFAHRIYRRSGLRNLDSVARRGEGLGCADGRGRRFDIHPTGMLALDVARIEAGLILADVDYVSSKKALIAVAEIHALRDWAWQAGALREGKFHRPKQALLAENKRGPERSSSDWRLTGTKSRRLFDDVGLAPQTPATASRVHVPVYKGASRWAKRLPPRGLRC